MKITSLSVKNFLGVTAVTIEPKQPVVVVAGGNAAGKTSLYQAIRLAFLEDLPRVDLKRDSDALVRDGAKTGSVTIRHRDNGNSTTMSVMLPGRERDGPVPEYAATLRFCLDHHAFAALEPKERMHAVLKLSGVKMTKEVIVARLAAHSVPETVIAELSPQLVLGFDKCAEIAKTRAAEHRGAWKQITKEVYGSKKAEGWTPPEAGALPEAPAMLAEAQEHYEHITMVLARAQTAQKQADEAVEKRQADLDSAARVEGLKRIIAAVRPIAESDVEPQTVACPECGAALILGPVDLALSAPVLVKYEATPKTKVKPAAKAKAVAELKKAEADLVVAQAAAARVGDAQDDAERPTDEEIAVMKEEQAGAQETLREVSEKQAAFDRAVAMRESTKTLAAQAQDAHLAVVAWETAAEALSPTGIQSELMTDAIKPLRAAILDVGNSESISEWPLPVLANDGAITASGRPYALLSKSEQYRVDLLLAAALASASGIRFIAADEADILEPKGRGELLSWLLDMTEGVSVLDAAWIFATLKQKPAPNPVVDAYWVNAGGIDGQANGQ